MPISVPPDRPVRATSPIPEPRVWSSRNSESFDDWMATNIPEPSGSATASWAQASLTRPLLTVAVCHPSPEGGRGVSLTPYV